MSTSEPLFLVALRLEALSLRLGAAGVEHERIGMGPARAVAACRRLSRAPLARPVVLIGCAGGLDPTLRPGDVVVASAVLEAGRAEAIDLEHAEEVAELVRRAPGLPSGARVELAPVVSSPKILSGTEARERARVGGAAVVDMESLWCAPLQRSRPFAVVRVVLDVPGRELFSPATATAALRCGRAIAASARALASWRPDSVGNDTLLEVGEH
jgi:4-hydroxy-3-methylbut-2-enyl diphosphate reductase